MQVTLTTRPPQWVMYHLQQAGMQGLVIDSIKDAEPPTPWDTPTTYIMVTKPEYLPPWGSMWLCSQDEADPIDTPDYTKEMVREIAHVLDTDLCTWLLAKYGDYPKAMGKLTLKLQVLAMLRGRVLTVGDVLPLVPAIDITSFLWNYLRTIGKPEGLRLIQHASNSDLWAAFMVDTGLMRYLKANRQEFVYSLLMMREEVRGNTAMGDGATLWHLSTMYH